MNLVRKLVDNDTFIEGINKETVKSILRQENSSVRMISVRHGNIILSNNKIIKCAKKYYADASGVPIPNSKSSHACVEYIKKLGVTCTPYSCLACHLQCLEKLREGNLTIK